MTQLEYPSYRIQRGASFQPIRRTSQIWVVTRYQYKFSALVSQGNYWVGCFLRLVALRGPVILMTIKRFIYIYTAGKSQRATAMAGNGVVYPSYVIDFVCIVAHEKQFYCFEVIRPQITNEDALLEEKLIPFAICTFHNTPCSSPP